ncbi:hypothetical protein EPD60_03355 [Flaviaesturariibacter flavus]|uniref:NodB homology domain-containing protein n=1 Tax=Flaviaesturariibacter flavus TaxID=2502780 RepID=A0A4R1BMT6_9BACT|nr:polysaccharide deacetylase family protein [Flaviaesturariibacter flavus]TCJ18811.1 hypothetical protein EPD60_03355 [Flaviaesturariibacter flavus]
MTTQPLGRPFFLHSRKKFLLLPLAQCILPLQLLRAIFLLAGPEAGKGTETAYVLVLYAILFVNTGLEMYAAGRLLLSFGTKAERAQIACPLLLAKACLWLLALAGYILCSVRYTGATSYEAITNSLFAIISASLLLPAWLPGSNGRLSIDRHVLLPHLAFCIVATLLTIIPGALQLLPLVAAVYALLVLWQLRQSLHKTGLRQASLWIAALRRFLHNGASFPIKYWIANQFSVAVLLLVAFLPMEEDAWVLAGAINVFLLEQALFLFPVIGFLLPFVQVAYIRSRRDGLERLQRLMPYVMLLSLGATIIALFLSDVIVTHYLGIRFAGATAIVSVLSPVLFFHLMNTLLGLQLFLNTKRKREYLRSFGFGFFLNMGLLILFKGFWHSNGAAFLLTLTEALLFGAYLIYLRLHQDPDLPSQFPHPGRIVNNLLHTLSEIAARAPKSTVAGLAFRYGPLVEATRRVDTTERVLYLTFDDGPDPLGTPFVLEQLRRYDARATFFCLGAAVARHPELYERVRAEGHAVGNHTYRHLDSWETPAKAYLADVSEAASLIDSPLFRPPYGHINRSRMRRMRHGGQPMQLVLWSVDSKDYDSGITPEQSFHNVVNAAGPGSIILCHDIDSSAPNLRVMLPRLLAHFTALGYRFEAIPVTGKPATRQSEPSVCISNHSSF